MNATIGCSAFRRRKMYIDQIYDLYIKPPTKVKKITSPGNQVESNDMVTDLLSPSRIPSSSSFIPVHDSVSVHVLSALTPQPGITSAFTSNISATGVWPYKKLNPSGVDSESTSHIKSAEHNQFDAAKTVSFVSVQHTPLSSKSQDSLCPECLSGKPGHYRHMQSRKST